MLSSVKKLTVFSNELFCESIDLRVLKLRVIRDVDIPMINNTTRISIKVKPL
jgi:hypothetical protein